MSRFDGLGCVINLPPMAGRPKLENHTMIQIMLPDRDIERIDTLMGPKRRGLLVRSAVERELKRLEALVRAEDRREIKARPPEEQD